MPRRWNEKKLKRERERERASFITSHWGEFYSGKSSNRGMIVPFNKKEKVRVALM